MEVTIAFISLFLAVASSSKCDLSAPLAKPSPLDNMKKISGKWYQTVSSNDYLSAEYICATISDVRVNSELVGFTALITNYYRETNPQSFHIYQGLAANGYLERIKIDNSRITSQRLAEKRIGNYKAADELHDVTVNFKEFSAISDGSRYVAYVNCVPEGWVVWIYTPQKILTTEELLFIHNELEKHGIHTELRLGECGNINSE